MSVHIIFGPGGSGKSAFQMHVLLKQLRETRRNVSTNLAVLVGKLNQYLDEHYPSEKLELLTRIRILTDEETKEFWKYRGPRRWVGDASSDFEPYKFEDDPGIYGCCFIIDEAGAAGFSSQGWAAGGESRTPRGVQCTAYLDQQRKYSDDVFASTNGRGPGQIAKGFRDKAHYFIKLKNGYLHKIGIFKGASKFTWKQYTEEPGPTSEPMAEGTFKIDSLMDCYQTEKGVGVIGANADKGARAKGIPMWTIIPACCALACLCVFVPLMLGRGVSKFVTGGAPAKAAGAFKPGTAAAPVAPQASDAPEVVAPVDVRPRPPVTAQAAAEEPVWVRSVAWGRNQVNVSLSDGRTLSEGDGILARIERNFIVLVDGRRVYWQKGAGVRVTPVRPDTEVPVVAVPAATDRKPIAEKQSPGPAVPPIEHTPPPQQQGSWVVGSDGVQRLVESPSFAVGLGR